MHDTHMSAGFDMGVTDHMLTWQPSDSANMPGPPGSGLRAETEKDGALHEQHFWYRAFSAAAPCSKVKKKEKNFTRFGQPIELITCANHGGTVISVWSLNSL